MRPAVALMLALGAAAGAPAAAGADAKLAAAPAAAAAPSPAAGHGALLPRDSRDAAVFRGGLVYVNYCVTCHGANADGNGRAARIYTPRPSNLRRTDKNDEYLALIVREGGERIARSPYMPPWGAELTEEQIRDVVAYLRSINAPGGTN
jgi:cytochrome c1